MNRCLGVFFVLFVLSGCAGGMDYKVLGGHMRAGNCQAATAFVEKAEGVYGRNSRLLFLLDAAQINMLCGRHEESNRYFHDAERLAEDLWTKSVSREAVALATNEYARPYGGEDFEKALVNLSSAVNYAVLNRMDEALVECRRLDSNLSLYNEKYEKKNVYKEDAFGRYLSAMIYESDGSLDDAYIDYYKAYRAYLNYGKQYGTPMPSILVMDLIRAAQATYRLEDLRAEFGIVEKSDPDYADTKELGRIVLIHYSGRSPVKREESIIIPLNSGPIKVAFPKYEASKTSCGKSEMIVSSASEDISARAELVEDINAIAIKNLDDRKARVVARTIARTAIKQGIIDAAASQIGDRELRRLTRIGLNVVNLAVERADTRSWRTLPAKIYLSRVYVPPGQYGVAVSMCGVRKKTSHTLDMKAGQTRFVLLHTIY
jgi:hypothetical protein